MNGLPALLSGAPETEIRANIRHALTLGLPDLQPQADQFVPLTVLANGPSADRAVANAPVMALNGALRLFGIHGGYPTYWAACDPGECVADFLVNAPEETTYFVASRCHPAVFRALRGRKVFVWHVGEPAAGSLLKGRFAIPSAASVTLLALRLGRMMGFRRIETWGWDGCFDAMGSHAVPQPYTGSRVRVSVGTQDGPAFDTTGTWLFEARDAMTVVPEMDVRLNIHGGGLFGAILKHNRIAQVI